MDPLTPDAVDELLSAEIDGEFDAAALDLGYEPAHARELLEGVPGVSERRAALTRAAGATQVPPLPEGAREALLARVRTATAGNRSRRARNVLGIAAAVLVVVGLGAVIAVNASDDASDDNRSAATAGDASAPTTLAETSRDVARGGSGEEASIPFDFGEVADGETLRARVESALVEPTAVPEALAPQSGDGEGAFADAPPVACVDSQARAAGVEPALVQHGIVVYQGEPAEVFVFARDADFLAVVVADASGSCRTVASQVVPSGDP